MKLIAKIFLFGILWAAAHGVVSASVVTNCAEADLRAAVAGGGTVTFASDGTITSPPSSQTAEAGSTVWFSVNTVSALPLTCLWFCDGYLISYSTDSFLQLSDLQFTQSGAYSVVVTNLDGATTSAPAMLNVIVPVAKRLVPVVQLMGEPGSALNLEYTDALGPAAIWLPLDSATLATASQLYFDVTEPLPPQRFYRTWQLGTPSVLPSLDLPYMVRGITLTGHPGDTVRVDCINPIGPTGAWVTLDTVTLTNTSQLYIHASAPGPPPLLYRIVPAPSPYVRIPAGWNTWYSYGSEISQDIIEYELTGLDYLRVLDLYPDFGIWIDDGWQASREQRTDPLQPPMWDPNKFPSGLSNTVALIHSHGYKAYLYTEPNPLTSAGFTGTYTNLEADARLFASWGFDGIKLDQPGWSGDDWRMDNLRRMMTAFKEAAPDREVVFWSSGWFATNASLISTAPPGSIIRYGYGFADWWNEGLDGDWYGVYLNFLKRVDSYISLDLLSANGQDHWLFTEAAINNTPVGRPIVSMWAMLAAPLIFSDLVATPEQIANATNPELYAIDQDPLFLAARPIQTNSTQMVWLKPLADGSLAVALLNRTRDTPQTIGFTWNDIGLENPRLATVRDVWTHTNLTVTSGSYTSSVPAQSVEVFRIVPVPLP